ncbi:MAG: hypothetical protein QM709_01300 [Spongiibacteraceae bacterium]
MQINVHSFFLRIVCIISTQSSANLIPAKGNDHRWSYARSHTNRTYFNEEIAMKKFLTVCGLIGAISLAAIAANAQQPQTTNNDQPMEKHRMMREHKFDPAERAAHLQKTLQLSDEQTAKIKKLFEDSEKQRNAIDEKYKPQFEAFHADMKKLHEQTHTQVNGVLTPKQQQAFEAQRKQHDEEMCPRHDNDGHGDKHSHR